MGVHPWWAHKESDTTLRRRLAVLEQCAPRLHAIGEIGLDYVRAKHRDERRHQRHVFEQQLRLASTLCKPVVLHCVRAAGDLLSILRANNVPALRGMVHGWSGSVEQARPLLETGFYLSFGPLILRESARKTRAALAQTPIKQLLLETDCPDNPLGESTRGEPRDLLAVAHAAATVMKLDPSEVLLQSTANARKLFGRLNF